MGVMIGTAFKSYSTQKDVRYSGKGVKAPKPKPDKALLFSSKDGQGKKELTERNILAVARGVPGMTVIEVMIALINNKSVKTQWVNGNVFSVRIA